MIWRVWGSILLRGFALAVALLGLAGIGSVATRASEASPRVPARAGLELSTLSGGALSILALGAAEPHLGASLASAGAPVPPPSAPALAGATAGAPSVHGQGTSEPGTSAPRPRHADGARLGPVPEQPVASPCPASAPAPEPLESAPRSSRPRSPMPMLAGERVDLNQADAQQLQRLPGVGAKRAEAILQLRERLGRFRRPGDLLRIKGIGPRTLERMLPYLVLE